MQKTQKILSALIGFLLISVGLSAQNRDLQLLVAVSEEKERESFQLLKAGADPNTSTYEGVTPLMYAADLGNLYLCKILLQFGADIDAKPNNGLSALHAATRSNRYEIIQYLLENEADPNIEDRNQRSPLHYACAYGYPRAADILLFYGADVNKQDNLYTPLSITSFYGDTLMVNLLLDYAADVNATGFFDDTPLMIASQENHLPVAELLYHAGAQLDLRNNSGLSALDIAVHKGHKEMAAYLISFGAVASSNIRDGISTAELAKIRGYPELEKILVNDTGSLSLTQGRFSASFIQNTSFQDYFFGLETGFHQSALNAELIFGWQQRPYRKKIMMQQNDFLFHQYREVRSLLYLSLHKNFAVYKKGYDEFGIYAGGSGAFYMAGYKGSKSKVRELAALPQAGIYRYGHLAGVKLGYEYAPLGYVDDNPHRYTLSIRIFFNKQFHYTERYMHY